MYAECGRNEVDPSGRRLHNEQEIGIAARSFARSRRPRVQQRWTNIQLCVEIFARYYCGECVEINIRDHKGIPGKK